MKQDEKVYIKEEHFSLEPEYHEDYVPIDEDGTIITLALPKDVREYIRQLRTLIIENNSKTSGSILCIECIPEDILLEHNCDKMFYDWHLKVFDNELYLQLMDKWSADIFEVRLTDLVEI